MIFGLSGSSGSISPLFQAASYRATQLSNLHYALISSAVSSRSSYKTSEGSEAVFLEALETRVTALKEAATALTASSSTPTFYTKAVISSDETAVTGTAETYTAAATYTINVTALAQEQVNTGTEMNLYDADFTTGLNTISIKVGDENAQQVSFDVSATDVNADVLSRMESVINNADMGVTAQYVKYSDAGTGRLVITGNGTGSNSALTIGDVSSDAVAISGIGTVTQNVADASYTLDGVASTSGTNTILAADGKIEFQLHRADGWDIDLTVGADSEGIRSDIETFAGVYNDLANFAAMNSGGFAGALTLWKDLSSILQKNENRLDDIGITVSGAGLMEVDSQTLEEEIESSVSNVRTIFSSATGVATKLRDEASSILAKPTTYTDDDKAPGSHTVKLASLTFMQKLEGYLGALDVFAESMAQLTTPSPYNDRSVSSSDETAVSGQATRSARRAWYTLNVTALAEKQVNQGAQLDSSTVSSFAVGDNTASIQVGSGPAKQVTFSVGATDTNDTVLRNFAEAINDANIGVDAKVVTYSTAGTSQLVFTSDSTGTGNAFTISDVTNTAVADSGIGAIARNAVNAAYSLNGEAATSQSNTLSLDSGEVSLTLNSADGWDVRVQVGTDLDSLVDNTEELVNYYNTLVSFLRENSGTYAGASTLERELSTLIQMRSSRLDDLGITTNTEDNSLLIDTDELRSAFENNFTSTRNILSSSTGVARELHDKIEEVTNSVWNYATPDTSSSSIWSVYTSSGALNRGLFAQSFLSTGSAINLFG